MFNNDKGDKSCEVGNLGPDSSVEAIATRDFLTYLDALEAGATLSGGLTLGRDAYHAWPQALKIDRLSSTPQVPAADVEQQQQLTTFTATRRAKHKPDRQRYGAIGRLEEIEEQIVQIRSRISEAVEVPLSSRRSSSRERRRLDLSASFPTGSKLDGSGLATPSGGAAVQGKGSDMDLGPLSLRRHSHATASCGRVDLADPRIAQRLCRIYAADYACFDYPLPATCQGLK
jgi:uncharacterized DUF497 family protein